MYGALDISTSGLVANRVRLETISANLANARSILNADGEYEPYRRRFAVLSAGDPHSGDGRGVHVSMIGVDDGPLEKRYEPGSPFADDQGYVGYPNVSPVIEQMNAMEASRSYEANLAAIEATKAMMTISLQIMSA